MMTREEKLYSMTMKALVAEAEKLGVKIDKKGSKQKAVEKMLAAEAEQQKPEEVVKIQLTGNEEMIDCTQEDDQPQEVAEVEEEPKQKKERKPREKKVPNGDILNLLAFITDEWQKVGIIKTPAKENVVFRPLCAENGRQVIKLMWTTKKISFFVRVEAATAHAEDWQKINYAMPFQCMFYHDNEETRQNIKDIFQLVLDVDSVRPKKEKKANKETK